MTHFDGQIRRRSLGRMAALVAAVVAFFAAGWAPAHAQPLLQRQTASSLLAGARAASTAANVPSPSETLYLRRRADYASEAAMIKAEIALVRAETATLRKFNGEVEKDVSAAAIEAEQIGEERLVAKRREIAALRRSLAAERERLSERLDGADGELRTTRHLREQAVDEKLRDDREIWRKREQELERERDRLRGLLERVSQLAATIG